MVANRITETEPIMLCEVFSDKKLSDQFLRKDIAAMSASESDANMMTQDSPQEAFAEDEERRHEGEDDTDVDEVNAEFVEVEALVKESSQVGRKELVKEVKKFLRSGASRRYLTGHFKISGTQQRLALNKILSYIPYKARLLLAPFCFVPESRWLN